MKKNISNILFAIFLVLLLIPNTRKSIQVGLQTMLSKIIPARIEKVTNKKIDTNFQVMLQGVNTPDLTLTLSGDKVIFVNFWATWCPPCIAELPALQKLYDTYGDRINFAFISSEKASVLQAFLHKNNYSLPVYQLNYDLPEIWKHRSIPTTYIIDKQGNLVLHKSGVANWGGDSFINQLEILLEK